MAKFLCIILFLFSSALSAQSIERYIRDSISKENSRKKEELLYKKLLFDFRNVDFDGLSKKIISDINFNQLKTENLVFYYRNLCNERRGFVFPDENICTFNTINPVFNQSVFWNEKNIKFIRKKYHKNVIPFLQRGSRFVSNSKNMDELTSYYFKASKQLIGWIRLQEKGSVIEKSTGYRINKKQEKETVMIEKRSDFYYFPDSKAKLILEIQDNIGRNFNTLYLEFLNFTGKIVTVKFTYNRDTSVVEEENEIYKSYQFINKKWVEIPTKEEYLFGF